MAGRADGVSDYALALLAVRAERPGFRAFWHITFIIVLKVLFQVVSSRILAQRTSLQNLR